MLREKKFWVGAVVSLGLLWLSARSVDWSQFLETLAKAHYAYLLPALFFYLIGYWSRAKRVSQLLKPVQPVPSSRVLPPLVIGFMFNNILPGRAGEFVFAFLLGQREKISRSASFAAVVLSRILDGFVILCFFLFGLLSFLPLAGGTEVGSGTLVIGGQSFAKQELLGKVYLAGFLGLIVFGAVFIGCFCLIVWKEFTLLVVDKMLGFFPEHFSRKGREGIEKFIAGLNILRDAKSLFAVFLFNFVPWTLEAATYWFTASALGLDLNVRQVCLVMGMTNLAMILPSAPGGLGLFEFAGLLAMGLFGLNLTHSLSYIVMVHVIIWLPINLWAFYFLVKEHIPFRAALSAGQQVE